MIGGLLVALGALSVATGGVLLSCWLTGDSPRAAAGRRGDSKADRWVLDVQFLCRIVLPLLAGGTLIAFGLRELLAG